MPVYYQEPPYDGPFDAQVFDPQVFATTANPREDPLYYCKVCRRPVVIDDRPGLRHPHFNWNEQGEMSL